MICVPFSHPHPLFLVQARFSIFEIHETLCHSGEHDLLCYSKLVLTWLQNTLIPNCKQCLYKTHEYRALHDVSFPTGPPPTESYKLVMYASPIPRGAVNRIQFRSRSPTLPGISMTQLLHYQTVGAEHDEEDFPYFEEHPRIRLVCPVRAFCSSNLSPLTCSSRPVAM